MDKYVVRQAIKALDNSIFGYEILYEKDKVYNAVEGQTAVDAVMNFLDQIGEKAFEGKTIFITFTTGMLFKSVPKIFDPNKIVIQIDDSVLVHPDSYDVLMKFKKQNYRIAINDFQFAPRYFSIMGVADFIKLNYGNIGDAKMFYDNIIKTAKGFQKKCIAYGVDTKESFDLAKKMGVEYLEGTYLEERISERVKKVDYINSNFFTLVLEITKNEPDLDEIESIIARDVALTFSVFKLVNSVYYATKIRPKSIKHALVILGLSGIKQWIYLLSFRQGEEDLREDLVKRSFLRANFCSELYKYTSIEDITEAEAYLMGMFSTLGVLLGAPLEEVLDEINISSAIKEALINNAGPCGALYNLILSYERADWKQINSYVEQLFIPKDNISQIYFNCVEKVNSIWSAFRAS